MNELIRAILPGTVLPYRGFLVPASFPSQLQHIMISIPSDMNTVGSLSRRRPMIEVIA